MLKKIGKSGGSHLIIGFTTIIISLVVLFYIFHSLGKLSEQCELANAPAGCKELNSITIPAMIILLIIGGFFLTICTTIYILISAGNP